jgi:hypothetical protein
MSGEAGSLGAWEKLTGSRLAFIVRPGAWKKTEKISVCIRLQWRDGKTLAMA